MAEDDSRAPVRAPAADDHAPKLHLFDAEGERKKSSGPVKWFLRHPMVVVVVVAIFATPFVYRMVRRATAPVEPTLQGEPPPMIPATAGPVEFKRGLTPLPDSEVAGPAGSSQPLTVRAMGQDGFPLAGALVTFRVVEGPGTLDVDTVRTDGAGLARTAILLPERPGRVRVVAALDDPELPGARFIATARAGAPTRAVVAAGDRQSAGVGDLLPQRLGILVTDGSGNPVPSVAVNFQVVAGGGMVAPSRTRTDSLGRAYAAWRLGPTPGTQAVVALAPDLNARLDFNAIAEGDTATAAVPDSAEGEAAPPLQGGAAVTVVSRTFVVGGSFVCAIPGGNLSCRGANDRGQRAGGSSTRFAAVAAGVSHACGLTAVGEASCWGANESGQLGDGSRTDRAAPVSVDTDVLFFAIAAGASHTCGLAAGGRALCWGGNLNGQLGDGAREDRPTPGVVSGAVRFATLTAGWDHTCGLTAANEAYCWGLNDHGQLGDGTQLDRLTPTRVPGRFRSLVAGSAHTCGIRDGQVFCWGSNAFGQLGDGSTQDRSRPVAVQGLSGTVSRLAAGAVSTCALLTDGTAWCWGQNLHGQVGDGTNVNRSTPTAVAGGLNFSSLFAGGALTCAFTDGGAQYCWGLNQSGQLGDGTRESRPVPTRVRGG